MIITLKNKDTLIIDEFRLKCCIGRGNLKKNKVEGDGSTPRGKFGIGTLYWRSDRVQKPNTKLFCKPINKKMGWCNDSKSKFYKPMVAVPSSYSQTYEKDLIKNGFKIVIYANHLMRAAYPAMLKVANTILTKNRALEADRTITPIKEILELI